MDGRNRPPEKSHRVNLSYREVEESFSSEGWNLAFLPVGCYEQHGPELPLNTDVLQAQELASRLASRLQSAGKGQPLVLPPIAYTPTDPNKGFAGTVTVSGEAFRHYLESVLRGIFHSDFSGIVVVNSHGSVDGALKETGFKLVFEQFDQGVSPVRPILCLNVYDAAHKAGQLFGQAIGRHADWTEFLMTYHLLGTEYYTKERLTRLQEFGESHDFTVKMPAVLGIPARYRTVDGVQGEPWPRGSDSLEEMAQRYWQLVEDEGYARLTRELQDFFQRFPR